MIRKNTLKKRLSSVMLSIVLCFGILATSDVTASAANTTPDYSDHYDTRIDGGEYDSNSNLRTVLQSATLLQENKVGGVLFLPVVTEIASNGDPRYEGTLGAAFKIQTGATEMFYSFNCMNQFCPQAISFTLYDSRYIQAPFSGTSSTFSLNQSTEKNLSIKLAANSTYYVLLSTNNNKELDSSCFGLVSYKTIADDFGSDFTTAATYTVGSELTHSFEGYDDTDILQFTTSAQKGFYNFTVSVPSTSVGLTDNLTILDGALNVVATLKAQAGEKKSEWYSLNPNTTYFIQLKPHKADATGAATINSVFVTDTANDTYETAGTINKETLITNKIECLLDTDVYTFNTGNCASLTLTITNANDSVGTVTASVCDSTGKSIGTITNLPIGQASYVAMPKKFAVNSDYYVVITSKEGNANYTFSVDRCTGTVTYNVDGGTLHKDTVSNYKSGDTVTLYNPVKKGYIFGGWYTDRNFTTKIDEISAALTNDTTDLQLYAKWDKVEFTYHATKKLTATKLKKTSAKINIPKGYIKPTIAGSGKKVYEVIYSTSSKFKNAKTVKLATNKTSIVLKGLKANKNYYVKVRMSYYDKAGNWTVYSTPSSTQILKFKTTKK